MTTISRRGMVRLVSYTAALVVALIRCGKAGGYAAANRYRTTIEYGYQRALGELSEYISNLDITLQKGRYATTENQLQGLGLQIMEGGRQRQELSGAAPPRRRRARRYP